MLTTDLLVLGGGAVGVSTLRNLTAKTNPKRRITLIDGGASQGKISPLSGGMIRVFHQNATISYWAQRSMQLFYEFAKRGGIQFHRTGALSFYPLEKLSWAKNQIEKLESYHSGLEYRILTPSEGKSLFPDLVWRRTEFAVYEPFAGFVDPQEYQKFCLESSQEYHQVEIVEEKVCSLLVQSHRVVGVLTPDRKIFSNLVILCAGVGTKALLEKIGIGTDLEVKPIQTHWIKNVGNKLPMIMDTQNRFFYCPRGEEGIVGFGLAPQSSLSTELDLRDYTTAMSFFHERTGGIFMQAELVRGTRALDAYTPNGLGLQGQVTGYQGLNVAVGLGGTGFKLAPYIGEMAAACAM